MKLDIRHLAFLGSLFLGTGTGITCVQNQRPAESAVSRRRPCEDEVVILTEGRHTQKTICRSDQFTVFETKGFVRCVCDRGDNDPEEGRELYDTDDCMDCVDTKVKRDAGGRRAH